ncbi:class I SAM-dependent methyltransferase, partial [Candidatus Falkowbacteria bacterium]|nr:class I SAM-dependent methyltransferase [Candidatus Falkowbacteria bacterium]
MLNLNGMAVEVGVGTGDYSEAILKNGRFSTVYSVDSWLEFDREVYKDMNNVPQKEQDKRYRFVLKRLRRFGKRNSVLRMASEQAVTLFKDDTLDFIYVDANHSYEVCKKDMELWWPKLREGGIFAGHDFLDGKLPTG